MPRTAKRLRVVLAGLAAASVLTACASAAPSSSDPTREARSTQSSDPSRASAPSSGTAHGAAPAMSYGPARASNAFGLALMRRLAPGNLVLSPSSIATALAMAGTGARGATAGQIAQALRLPSPAAFEALGDLQRALASEQPDAGSPHAPTLDLADGLFVQSGFALAPTFLGGLSTRFAATPQQVDFAHEAPAAAATINGWVSEHTGGLIHQIVSGLSPETRLLLANAVYLKAEWAQTFKTGATHDATFHTSAGGVSTPFMHETTTLPYGSGHDYRLVELPYADSTLSLAVILPVGIGVQRLLSSLSAPSLATMLSRTRNVAVELALPRFTLSFHERLNTALQALGMTDAFSPRADFDGMTAQPEPLHISAVEHAADFEVDEQGTIAAAATTVGVEATAIELPPRHPVTFVADRPLLFFLRDSRTGEILFAGRLTDPASSQS
jgi:serpin B